jgi:hypothetical protein
VSALSSTGICLDHVFIISSENNNWNCFGGGKEEACKQYEIASTQGFIEWARLVYGPENEGREGRPPNAYPAADVTELYNGVCQNVANRILLLADTNIDVRKAHGNALVTLLYGKYGFGIDIFIEKIKSTARQLNVTHLELDKVLRCIIQGQTAESELNILKSIYEIKTGQPFPVIPNDLYTRLTTAHTAFQVRRTEEFNRLSQTKAGQDIRKDLVDALKPDLKEYYKILEEIFGRDVVLNMMQVLPANISLALKAFDGSR